VIRWQSERTTSDGLLERSFEITVDGESVPGLLWLPSGGEAPRPLVLGGHGYRVDKRVPFPLPQIRSLASSGGCAVAILDAPGHGDRRADPGQSAEATALAYQSHWQQYAGKRIAREYEEAARLLKTLPEIGAGPIGYWGLSLGTQYGLAYLATSRDVKAAVLGLFRKGRVVEYYAKRVRCPVFFVQQLDDEVHPGETVRELFEAIASDEKHLAASPGAHVEVPEAVLQSAVDFLLGHLRDSS
jgi:cephalosporin-C deacetylase-like acetyl esterase